MLCPVIERPLHGGVQKVYKFENGFGASVVRHDGSYGHQQGLWELAVIEFDSQGKWDLCYTTPITSDVIGHLNENEIADILEKIQILQKED